MQARCFQKLAWDEKYLVRLSFHHTAISGICLAAGEKNDKTLDKQEENMAVYFKLAHERKAEIKKVKNK